MNCSSMAEVRANIDALDEQIVALLARRTGFVAQAARIKGDESQIVDKARIEYIVNRVKRQAAGLGAPDDVVEAAYRALIDASIAFERRQFALLRGKAVS
ncbi:chorismate mutase [Ramlibacter sp. PS4R-6]|uniref:chorismate mutase n=1 Tax=Ramlibacter sp. PS4R-6 TaxID=3133438 RepID=UPI00309E9595